MGYLSWDLAWIVWHYESTPDVEIIAHHSLFLLTAHYNARGWYFSKCFAWMAMAEISTLFLNNRWFLLTLGKKESTGYVVNSIGFAATFLLIRIGLGTWGLHDVWINQEHWEKGSRGVYVVIVGL